MVYCGRGAGNSRSSVNHSNGTVIEIWHCFRSWSGIDGHVGGALEPDVCGTFDKFLSVQQGLFPARFADIAATRN